MDSRNVYDIKLELLVQLDPNSPNFFTKSLTLSDFPSQYLTKEFWNSFFLDHGLEPLDVTYCSMLQYIARFHIAKLNNDMYKNFISATIIEMPGKSITTSDVYNKFKQWYRNEYLNLKYPNKPTVIFELNKRFGSHVQGGWLDKDFN